MSDHPHLVFATGIYPPDIGGPATYVARLSAELASRGWPVRVVSYGEPACSGDSAEIAGLPEKSITRVSRHQTIAGRYRSFAQALTEACEASRYRPIVFAQDPLSSGLPARWVCRSKRAVFVLKIVGDLAWEIARSRGWTRETIEAFQTQRYLPGRTWLARGAERRVARVANHVITPSHYLANLVSQWGVQPERLSVIHNGAEPARAQPATTESSDGQVVSGLPEPPWLFTAGRLVPWKGFDLVIESLARLAPQYPRLRLLIAGGGDEEHRLKQLSAKLHMAERVIFLGPLNPDDLSQVMRRANALVLASSYEGLSHLLIEAMQLAVPVVASRNGGNPELIRDGVDGYLFDRDTPTMLDDRLRAILDNDQTSAALGERARQRANQFRWSTTLEQTSSLLERIASQPS